MRLERETSRRARPSISSPVKIDVRRCAVSSTPKCAGRGTARSPTWSAPWSSTTSVSQSTATFGVASIRSSAVARHGPREPGPRTSTLTWRAWLASNTRRLAGRVFLRRPARRRRRGRAGPRRSGPVRDAAALELREVRNLRPAIARAGRHHDGARPDTAVGGSERGPDRGRTLCRSPDRRRATTGLYARCLRGTRAYASSLASSACRDGRRDSATVNCPPAISSAPLQDDDRSVPRNAPWHRPYASPAGARADDRHVVRLRPEARATSPSATASSCFEGFLSTAPFGMTTSGSSPGSGAMRARSEEPSAVRVRIDLPGRNRAALEEVRHPRHVRGPESADEHRPPKPISMSATRRRIARAGSARRAPPRRRAASKRVGRDDDRRNGRSRVGRQRPGPASRERSDLGHDLARRRPPSFPRAAPRSAARTRRPA